MPKPQQYSNHRHWVPLYHFLTLPAMLLLLAGAAYVLKSTAGGSRAPAALFGLAVLVIISVSFHCRSFALKAQDRAIRAEESLRYFILTGQRLPDALTLNQVIALRFASDEEFVFLVNRAVAEHLSPDTIKRSIRQWRPDTYRA